MTKGYVLVLPVVETKHTQLGARHLRFPHADQKEHSGRDVSNSRDQGSLAHKLKIKGSDSSKKSKNISRKEGTGETAGICKRACSWTSGTANSISVDGYLTQLISRA